jgi:hypothetical protein
VLSQHKHIIILCTDKSSVSTAAETDGPCAKDPCMNIARAVVGSCQSLGRTDFTCGCQRSFIWQDDTNMCAADTGIGNVYRYHTTYVLLASFKFDFFT